MPFEFFSQIGTWKHNALSYKDFRAVLAVWIPDYYVISRHTVNAVLKQVGLPKQFLFFNLDLMIIKA